MKKSNTYSQVKSKQAKKIVDFVRSVSPEYQKMVEQLREIIFRAAPGIEECIKWNKPCYSAAGNVCYIACFKDHINFGFYKGAEINDQEELLVGTGKILRHIKIRDRADIRVRAFTHLIKNAVKLNNE